MDASTFGGPDNPIALPDADRREGVPVIVVRCGESLENALNLSNKARSSPLAN
jgi:hypothetical protein